MTIKQEKWYWNKLYLTVKQLFSVIFYISKSQKTSLSDIFCSFCVLKFQVTAPSCRYCNYQDLVPLQRVVTTKFLVPMYVNQRKAKFNSLN